MRNQRRLLVILSLILAALVLFAVFGPEPIRDQPAPDELAQWIVPQNDEWRDVGDPTVDWYDLTITVPVDPNDPCGDVVELTIPQACWMPADEPSNEYPYI